LYLCNEKTAQKMDLLEILANQQKEIQSTDIKRLCHREEEAEFDLDSPLAQVVIGVRRSGKSTLCQKVLLESGRKFAYINFDDEHLSTLNATELNDTLATLHRLLGDFNHLFLDEIQNIEGWPLFVNRLLRQGIHLIITGSNANLLSGELATHLTGRYNQISLFPFSFQEYCELSHTDTSSFTTKERALRQRALDQYLLRGGMPEIYGIKRPDKYIQSLFEAIITKDICRRYKIRYRKTLTDMANNLVDHYCQELSFTQLAKQMGLTSVHTAKDYVNYLSNAFLVCLVPKYTFKTTERQQTRKCYVVDTSFVDNRKDTLLTEGYGWRLENAVAIELMRRIEQEYQQLYYLRKSKDYEVDFVVTQRGHARQLIQVTYDFESPSTKLYNREIGGLLKGAKATQCDKLTLIVGSGKSEELHVEGFTIHKVLATDWFLEKTDSWKEV